MKNIMLFATFLFLFSNCGSVQPVTKTALPVKLPVELPAELPAKLANTTKLTDNNFKEKVLDNEKVSVVYFWANWCGPCDITSPVIDHLSQEPVKQANFGAVDVDECPKITSKYNVRLLPMVLVIKDGEVVDQNVGGFSYSLIRGMIKEHAQL